MTEIKRVLKRAAWRLFVIDVMRTAAVTSSAVIFVVIAARVTDFYWPWVATVAGGWLGFIGGATGTAVVATLLWSALRRARALEVARQVDQRANLREMRRMWVHATALTEDLSLGDATTDALISPELTAKAVVIAKEEGVLAGIDVSMAVFKRVDPKLNTRALKDDSSILNAGDVVASLEGSVASILEAERTALNFLQRLSGIATATRDYVRAVEGYDAQIIDTRK
ncbi:MAG: hypothetical protein IH985_10220, partial [Planctomycetes bacterium]|nr:hypothetical protein [Planctomycetota bacterium]